MEYRELYDFWFAGLGHEPDYLDDRMQLWFQKNDENDQVMREAFLPLLESYPGPNFEKWGQTISGTTALVVLLDQIPRNCFRGTAKCYSFDEQALAVCKSVLKSGVDQNAHPLERMFLYLPLEHSEDLDDQKQCVQLFKQMQDNVAEPLQNFADQAYDYAVKHLEIVQRFGRFPHRNQILNRESTPEEIEFFKDPGEFLLGPRLATIGLWVMFTSPGRFTKILTTARRLDN